MTEAFIRRAERNCRRKLTPGLYHGFLIERGNRGNWWVTGISRWPHPFGSKLDARAAINDVVAKMRPETRRMVGIEWRGLSDAL